MENIKTLMLSMLFVVPAVAMAPKETIDLRLEAMHKADMALFDLIENCDKDNEIESRINTFRDNSYNLSVAECKSIFDLHVKSAKRKFEQNQCNDCTRMKWFIVESADFLSKAIEEGKGDMLVVNFARELKKK